MRHTDSRDSQDSALGMEMSAGVVSRRVSERWLAHLLFEVGKALAVPHVVAVDSAPAPQSWQAGLTISLCARAGRADLLRRRAGCRLIAALRSISPLAPFRF